MDNQELSNNDVKFKRIRRVKKLLRHIPRRTSIHRYPILKYFAESARKRSYLWSFRTQDVTPALYLGCVLTLCPIPSFLQIIIAFFLAFISRANAMILMGLQLLSNPFTFLFLWSITYKTGDWAVNLLGGDTLQAIHDTYSFGLAHVGSYGRVVVRWFATTVFGAMILGTIIGFLLSTIYKFIAKGTKKH